MNYLTRFNNDVIVLLIDTQTGEAFATQAGYARMSGLSQQAVNKRCRGYNQDDMANVEIDLGHGLQGYNLIPAKLVYRWLMKDCPDLGLAMGEAGATVYLHQLAGFKVVSTALAIAPAAQPEPAKLGSSVAATISMLSPLKMLLSSVPDALVDGFLLNQVQVYHPEIKDTINAAHGLLAATNAIPELLLTPTAIGKRLGVSARIVNAVLVANGYQVKNVSKGKTEPAYLPTEKGKEFSSNTLATGRSTDNTGYQHIKWQESIVGIVQDLIE